MKRWGANRGYVKPHLRGPGKEAETGTQARASAAFRQLRDSGEALSLPGRQRLTGEMAILVPAAYKACEEEGCGKAPQSDPCHLVGMWAGGFGFCSISQTLCNGLLFSSEERLLKD